MYESISPTLGPEYYSALQKVLLTVGILCVISMLSLIFWLAAVLMYGRRSTRSRRTIDDYESGATWPCSKPAKGELP